MKMTSLKIFLLFLLSPGILGGPLFIIFVYIDSLNSTDNFHVNLFQLLGELVGAIFVGFIFFCIPASITGLTYLKIRTLNPVLQIIICTFTGFILCYLWSSLIFASSMPMFKYLLTGIGAITSIIVSSLINYLMSRSIKKTQKNR